MQSRAPETREWIREDEDRVILLRNEYERKGVEALIRQLIRLERQILNAKIICDTRHFSEKQN